MLTVAEYYKFVGEDITDRPVLEQNYIALQIQVAEEAIRNYTRRYMSPMVWEDRYQRPNAITLFETPVIYVDRVIVDGHRLDETMYYFYAATGRLFTRMDGNLGWPYGNMWWVSDANVTPEQLPQYYGNWKGFGSVVVLYKAGYIPTPLVIKQVIADYVYERVTVVRASQSSGGIITIPAGTISSISIEGVGTVKYSGGASTVAYSSSRAQTSGEPIIGAAGSLLDAYLEVAVAVPGLNGLVGHRQAVLSGVGAAALRSDNPGDLMLYSDDPNDYYLKDSQGTQILTLFPQQPSGLSLWSGVSWNGIEW